MRKRRIKVLNRNASSNIYQQLLNPLTGAVINNPEAYSSVNPGFVEGLKTHTPFYMTVAHELIHADRMARGMAIPLVEPGERGIEYRASQEYKIQEYNAMTDSWDNGVFSYTYLHPIEELRTTGIASFQRLPNMPIHRNDTPYAINGVPVTENTIRSEQGLWLRGVYR